MVTGISDISVNRFNVPFLISHTARETFQCAINQLFYGYLFLAIFTVIIIMIFIRNGVKNWLCIFKWWLQLYMSSYIFKDIFSPLYCHEIYFETKKEFVKSWLNIRMSLRITYIKMNNPVCDKYLNSPLGTPVLTRT